MEETSVDQKMCPETMENGSSNCQSAVSPPPEIVWKHTASEWYEAEYPVLGFYSRRELTFRKWSPDIKQTPQELSEAGFFCLGKSLF